jgi:hypothetical protein
MAIQCVASSSNAVQNHTRAKHNSGLRSYIASPVRTKLAQTGHLEHHWAPARIAGKTFAAGQASNFFVNALPVEAKCLILGCSMPLVCRSVARPYLRAPALGKRRSPLKRGQFPAKSVTDEVIAVRSRA